MSKLLKQVVAVAGLVSAVGFARGGELYDSSAYEQNGLIAHWDACENAGRGLRDDNLTTWKDLTGNHDDLVFPNGCVMGADANGVYYYNLAGDAQGDHGCCLTSCADIAQAIIDKACTVEIVCDIASQVQDGTVVSVLGVDTSKRILWARTNNSMAYGCIGAAEYLATAGWEFPNIDNNVLNVIRSYSLVCDGSACVFYKDGEATGESVAQAGLTVDSLATTLSFGSRRAAQTMTAGAAADMKIYAVRIYNRVLTAEELAANAKIDEARIFNGQFLMGHQLVIESEAGEVGEPEPMYGRHLGTPGQETTCTAPDTVKTASATFACVGCQLYTNTLENTSVWLPWGEPQAGHAVTFKFPDEVSVKVVWRWDAETKLDSSFVKSIGAGKDAVSVLYMIGDFSGIPEVGVRLQYGTAPESLVHVADGGIITSKGRHGVTFRGFESGRCYWGKVVFTVAGKSVSETEVFTFATTDRIAYWPLNSSNLQKGTTVTNFTDQSGNGYELVIDSGHVAVESDPESPDGECARMDGAGSYLKTVYDPATVGDDWLWLNQAEGLTFFFRLKGCDNPNSGATSYSIFETSENYNQYAGALNVHAEKKDDGKWYLVVGECASSQSAYAIYRCKEPLDDSDWQNIVVVFTKQDAPACFAVYVNGVRQELEVWGDGYDTSMKGVPYLNKYLYIGGRAGAGTTVGRLDDFGVCGYAYDADEVAQLTDELSAKSGSLFVEATDGGACSMQPAAGDHSGFAAGQVVPFERRDLDGVTRVWSLLAYDDARDEWTEVERGYGHCGTFTHTGGKMRLRWGIDKTSQPICRWAFEDQTGRNTGLFGADCDLNLVGNANAADGCLAVPYEDSSYAHTMNNLDLTGVREMSAAFWVRNPKRKNAGILLELSPNYSGCSGSFYVSYNTETHKWEIGRKSQWGDLSIVGYDDSGVKMLEDGNWHHCVAVYRNGVWPNIDLYVDGVKMTVNDPYPQYKSNTKNFTFAGDQKLYLCGRGLKTSQQATLDNVTFYSQALTADGVAALYATERQEKGGAAIAVPDDAATLVVTAKKCVPTDDLPIPGFGTTCLCTAGEKLSFDFTRAPYTVEGSEGRYRLTGWKLYRLVDGEWTIYQSGSNPLVEFVHPGGAVKLELNFAVPGMIILFQ